MSYKVTRTKRFDERLTELEKQTQDRIISKLKEFQKQIKDYGLDPKQHNSTKFIAEKSTWRLKIGDYRAFFDILENEIKFTTVLPRDKAYR
ncbi:type II toxin-antitoxin system RelE family toxin [Candidatus Nanohalobium constans]|uniref:mRNA interferase RelE/StbE n=1 Tax=Candidatus Nanohalobium constans TaxID=2565781 RepID=A0A5Q0UGP4_9ARCH|nr:type II toxin-antitoxin system RelE/ParE family toxin [Candidatus Nanohalobium constans]QGA80746.1 mRNA interferase RelE/StbE [Candidatus Nanohalobium constans]